MIQQHDVALFTVFAAAVHHHCFSAASTHVCMYVCRLLASLNAETDHLWSWRIVLLGEHLRVRLGLLSHPLRRVSDAPLRLRRRE